MRGSRSSSPGSEPRRSADRLYGLVVGAVTIFALLPILLVSHPPMQDLPNHLAIAATLARADDPGWSRDFAGGLEPRPYVAYYAALLLLEPVLGVAGANRVLLAFYVVAFLAAARFLIAAVGGNRWTLLLFVPLVYSDFYLIGLTNFLLGMPLLLFGAGILGRALAADRVTALETLTLGTTAVLLYFTHPLTLLYLLATAVGVAVFARRRGRLLAVLGAALLPAALLLAVYARGHAGFGGAPAWPDLGFKLRYFMTTPLLFVDAVDPVLFWIGAAFLAPLLVAAAGRIFAAVRRAGWRRAFPPGRLALAALPLLAYFAAPAIAGATVWFDARLGYLAWIASVLATGRYFLRSRAEKLAAVGLCAVVLSTVLLGHLRFEREIEPLFAVLEAAPSGARVLPVAIDPRSDALAPFYARSGEMPWFSLYAQAGAYYHLRQGGVSPFMTFYAGLPWLPLRLRDPFYETAFAITDPFAPIELLRRLPAYADRFDLLLVRGLTGDLETLLRPLARPLARAGPFTLLTIEPRAAERP